MEAIEAPNNVATATRMRPRSAFMGLPEWLSFLIAIVDIGLHHIEQMFCSTSHSPKQATRDLVPTLLPVAVDEIHSQTDPTEENTLDVLSKQLVAQGRIRTHDVELKPRRAALCRDDDVRVRTGNAQSPIVGFPRFASAHPSMPANVSTESRSEALRFTVADDAGVMVNDGVDAGNRWDLRGAKRTRKRHPSATSPVDV